MPPLPERISPTLRAIHEARQKARMQFRESPNISVSEAYSECSRAIWYDLRWVSPEEQFSPRMLRLFNTGHKEEKRLLDDLERIDGVVVKRFDPQTGKQWKVNIGNFVVGRLDALAIGIPESPNRWHVVECKSSNDKGFKSLKNKGVKEAKPEHWLQMQLYMLGMLHMGIERALYMSVNKNDDEEYIERVRFDGDAARRAVAWLERVAQAPQPPGQLHSDPDAKGAWHCSWCRHRPVCHDGALARRNCRTCLNVTPRADGAWRCERWDKDLTVEEQRVGCDKHLLIPDLVAGEQIDADAVRETVTYRMADGSVWADGEER
jgi:hypothetical protein